MNKQQIEVDPVDADQLPVEYPITYEQICTIIGSLYLDGVRKSTGIEEQAKSLLNQMNDQLEFLRSENTELKKELKESSVE